MTRGTSENEKTLSRNRFGAKNERKQRDAGSELLRIFAILLIIIFHIDVYGGIKYDSLSVRYAVLETMKNGRYPDRYIKPAVLTV